MFAFSHHTDAQDWVKNNAVGPVCVIDSWTYGKMLFFPFECNGYLSGWTTNTLAENSGARFVRESNCKTCHGVGFDYLSQPCGCQDRVARWGRELLGSGRVD